MSKDKISDYSETPGNNTDIGGINIAEGMLPSDVNNAIREQMAQLKKFQSGTSGESVTFVTANVTTANAGQVNVDNLRLDGNTLSSTNTNGDIELTPNGNGRVTTPALSATSPRVITAINDTNGNELFGVTATGSAVNEFTVANAATGNAPTLSATGGDTNIGMALTPKGTGGVIFPAGAVGTPSITTTGDLNTGIYFPAADTIAFTEGGAEAMRIDSSGNVLIGKTSATANGGDLQVSSGITFPATQVAKSDANTLDDYEEGTWQPTIVGLTSAGVGTYTNQNGLYTKIGRIVTIQGELGWSAHTGTGSMTLGNFPFPVKSTGGGITYSSGVIGYFENLAFSANTSSSLLTQLNGATFAFIVESPVGGGTSALMNMDTAAKIYFQLTYATD
jgi:hypothetical protein